MKMRLDNEDLSDDFFEDAKLLGIVAPLKGYRFCWELNRQLRLDFRINNQIKIQLIKKQRQYFFNVFECCEPNRTLVHYLYNNQFDGEYLIPEFKHLDFFWLLKGDEVADEILGHLISSIREIKGVQLVTELTPAKIRHKENLIF